MFETDVKVRAADMRYGQAGSRVGPDWVSPAPQLAVEGISKRAA